MTTNQRSMKKNLAALIARVSSPLVGPAAVLPYLGSRTPRAQSGDTRLQRRLTPRRFEVCARPLAARLGLAPSTISRHLARLPHAGQARPSRTERRVCFTRSDDHAPALIRQASGWVFQGFGRRPEATADARQLREILRQSPTQLSKRLCRRRRFRFGALTRHGVKPSTSTTLASCDER